MGCVVGAGRRATLRSHRPTPRPVCSVWLCRREKEALSPDARKRGAAAPAAMGWRACSGSRVIKVIYDRSVCETQRVLQKSRCSITLITRGARCASRCAPRRRDRTARPRSRCAGAGRRDSGLQRSVRTPPAPVSRRRRCAGARRHALTAGSGGGKLRGTIRPVEDCCQIAVRPEVQAWGHVCSQACSGLTCHPVTVEIVGSNPIGVASAPAATLVQP